MTTSPSAAQPSSSMEEPQQPDQPISSQQDGAVVHVAVTSQPISAEQQAPPPTDAPQAKQTEEADVEHLTVISDGMETSKYDNCAAPVHKPLRAPPTAAFSVSSQRFFFM